MLQIRVLRRGFISIRIASLQGRVIDYSTEATEVRQAFGGPVAQELVTEVITPAFGDSSNGLNQHRVFVEAAR